MKRIRIRNDLKSLIRIRNYLVGRIRIRTFNHPAGRIRIKNEKFRIRRTVYHGHKTPIGTVPYIYIMRIVYIRDIDKALAKEEEMARQEGKEAEAKKEREDL